jgi:hypothetical protein
MGNRPFDSWRLIRKHDISSYATELEIENNKGLRRGFEQ